MPFGGAEALEELSGGGDLVLHEFVPLVEAAVGGAGGVGDKAVFFGGAVIALFEGERGEGIAVGEVVEHPAMGSHVDGTVGFVVPGIGKGGGAGAGRRTRDDGDADGGGGGAHAGIMIGIGIGDQVGGDGKGSGVKYSADSGRTVDEVLPARWHAAFKAERPGGGGGLDVVAGGDGHVWRRIDGDGIGRGSRPGSTAGFISLDIEAAAGGSQVKSKVGAGAVVGDGHSGGRYIPPGIAVGIVDGGDGIGTGPGLADGRGTADGSGGIGDQHQGHRESGSSGGADHPGGIGDGFLHADSDGIGIAPGDIDAGVGSREGSPPGDGPQVGMVGLGSADGIGADGLPAGGGRPGDDGRRIGVDGDVIEGSEGIAVGRLALVDLVDLDRAQGTAAPVDGDGVGMVAGKGGGPGEGPDVIMVGYVGGGVDGCGLVGADLLRPGDDRCRQGVHGNIFHGGSGSGTAGSSHGIVDIDRLCSDGIPEDGNDIGPSAGGDGPSGRYVPEVEGHPAFGGVGGGLPDADGPEPGNCRYGQGVDLDGIDGRRDGGTAVGINIVDRDALVAQGVPGDLHAGRAGSGDDGSPGHRPGITRLPGFGAV